MNAPDIDFAETTPDIQSPTAAEVSTPPAEGRVIPTPVAASERFAAFADDLIAEIFSEPTEPGGTTAEQVRLVKYASTFLLEAARRSNIATGVAYLWPPTPATAEGLGIALPATDPNNPPAYLKSARSNCFDSPDGRLMYQEFAEEFLRCIGPVEVPPSIVS